MNISSRTPEGQPNRCPLCGHDLQIEPSLPTRDAPCPNCGQLLWFTSSRVDLNLIEQTRKHINQLVEDIAGLSKLDLAPVDYFGEFLKRVQKALACTAGAVWIFTPQGHLQLQFQINLRQVGVDAGDAQPQRHAELLRHVVANAQAKIMAPNTPVEGIASDKSAGNPTDYVILLVPIFVDGQVQGLVEVFQDPTRNPNALRGYLEFLRGVADLAAAYHRNSNLRRTSAQYSTRTVHNSSRAFRMKLGVVCIACIALLLVLVRQTGLIGLGPLELSLLLILGVLFLGRRLPDVGRYVGRGIMEFKKRLHGLEDELGDR